MQIIIDIQDDSIADKIIGILSVFKSDGVKIKKQLSSKEENEIEFSNEYIEKNWKELGMNTHSVGLDDDERLYDAAWEFYSEKHSN